MTGKLFSGQIIIEMLVAVAVISVGLLALVQLATKSVSNAGSAKRQSQATAYAQEGMEWISNQKDNVVDWTKFYSLVNPNPYNLGYFPTSPQDITNLGSVSTSAIGTTEYSRTVTFSSPGANQVDVLVTVSWWDSSGGGGSRQAQATQETVFAKY